MRELFCPEGLSSVTGPSGHMTLLTVPTKMLRQMFVIEGFHCAEQVIRR